MTFDRHLQPVVEVAGLHLGRPVGMGLEHRRHQLFQAAPGFRRQGDDRRALHLRQLPLGFLDELGQLGLRILDQVPLGQDENQRPAFTLDQIGDLITPEDQSSGDAVNKTNFAFRCDDALKSGGGLAVRVLATPSLLLEIVPEAVASLSADYPDSRFYVESQLVREMVRLLLDGWAAAPAKGPAAAWQGLEARIAKLEGRLKPAARTRETEESK